MRTGELEEEMPGLRMHCVYKVVRSKGVKWNITITSEKARRLMPC